MEEEEGGVMYVQYILYVCMWGDSSRPPRFEVFKEKEEEVVEEEEGGGDDLSRK